MAPADDQWGGVGWAAPLPDQGGESWHLPPGLAPFPAQEATSPVELVGPRRHRCRPWVFLQSPDGCSQHHGHLMGSAALPAHG